MDTSKNIGSTLKKYTMLLALVAVIIFFYFSTDGRILLPGNINNLVSQNAYVFVLATGMLLCILTGGNIDLAVGSVVCFTGGVGVVMMEKDLPIVLAVVVMLVLGLLVGMWQGFWIAYMKVPPFIATLAGMFAFRGLSNIILSGYTVDVSPRNKAFLDIFGGGADCYVPDFFNGPENFNIFCFVVGIIIAIGFAAYTVINRIRLVKQGYNVDSIVSTIIKTVIIDAALVYIFCFKLARYKGIPTALIWITLVLGIFAYVTKKTTLGRNLYAVGGNEKATRLSGINTKKVFFVAYSLMGLLSGFAGVLTTARLVGMAPTYGQGYEMDAIAACFIGGASAYGGVGTIGGAIIGATLMGVINQGMIIMGISPNIQRVVKGLVLLAAVLFDVLSKKKKK